MDKDYSDVFGVAYQCPAGEREANCPLKDFNDLSFKRKVEMIKTMSNEDIENIINHHKHCSKIRDHISKNNCCY